MKSIILINKRKGFFRYSFIQPDAGLLKFGICPIFLFLKKICHKTRTFFAGFIGNKLASKKNKAKMKRIIRFGLDNSMTLVTNFAIRHREIEKSLNLMHYLFNVCEKKCKKQVRFLMLKIGVALGHWPWFRMEVELKKAICLFIWISFLAGCAVNRYRSDFEFANKLAAEGLWKEAYYRWQKALPVHGGSAALHNNLAVALESLNRLPEAEQEYQQAVKLAPGNTLIKGNYDRFRKNLGKEKKRGKNEK